MNESKINQEIIIHDGKHLTVTGVNKILAFDDGYMKIDTTLGAVYVEGKSLAIENLSKDKKELSVNGRVTLVEIKSTEKLK